TLGRHPDAGANPCLAGRVRGNCALDPVLARRGEGLSHPMRAQAGHGMASSTLFYRRSTCQHSAKSPYSVGVVFGARKPFSRSCVESWASDQVTLADTWSTLPMSRYVPHVPDMPKWWKSPSIRTSSAMANC